MPNRSGNGSWWTRCTDKVGRHLQRRLKMRHGLGSLRLRSAFGRLGSCPCHWNVFWVSAVFLDDRFDRARHIMNNLRPETRAYGPDATFWVMAGTGRPEEQEEIKYKQVQEPARFRYDLYGNRCPRSSPAAWQYHRACKAQETT